MTLIYITFSTDNAYESWEQSQEDALNMPITGRRQSDGVLQPLKQKTIRFSNKRLHPDNEGTPANKNLLVIAEDFKVPNIAGATLITFEQAVADGWFTIPLNP